VSSPLPSLQKPVCVNRAEGLQATGKAGLGCCFPANCSVHHESYKWGKIVGLKVQEFILGYSKHYLADAQGVCQKIPPERTD